MVALAGGVGGDTAAVVMTDAVAAAARWVVELFEGGFVAPLGVVTRARALMLRDGEALAFV